MIESCSQRADFVALKRSNRISGQHFWLMFSPDPSLDNPRVAYAIGRHFGNAVQRNRVRRQAKAVLRETQTELPKGRYLIGIRGSSPAPEFRQLRDELNGLLMRIKDHK